MWRTLLLIAQACNSFDGEVLPPSGTKILSLHVSLLKTKHGQLLLACFLSCRFTSYCLKKEGDMQTTNIVKIVFCRILICKSIKKLFTLLSQSLDEVEAEIHP